MVEQQETRQFGANSWMVEEMYRDYLADPDSVGESWKEFFSDYQPAWSSAAVVPAQSSSPAPSSSTPAPPSGSGTADRQPAPDGGAGSGSGAAGRQPTPDGGGRSARASSSPAGDGSASQAGEGAEGESVPEGATPLRGVASVIAENMVESLGVPTATSIRVVPAKLLEVNRKIANNQLGRTRGGKLSFTHLIGWAIVRAMGHMPQMTSSYHEAGGKRYVHRPEHLNLGLAVDVERKDGSRILLVPNIKAADTVDFAGFFRAYEDVIRRIRANDLAPELFADTTATLTNPGTVGTVGSVPRLMPGQSVIVGVGAIDHPAEYKAADPRTLAQLGVGKVITITSTYDHRVIQGAESGLFLRVIEELLLGDHAFYDEVFDSLHIPYEPVRWRRDEHIASAPTGSAAHADKQVAVGKIVNAYRVRGHLIANLNPLAHTFQRVHAELDPATYGLSIWDLDRTFATGGLAGKDWMTLGDILGVLRDAYCRTVGVEYMHIQERDQKRWIQDRVEGVKTTLDVADQRHILSELNAAEAFEKFLHTKYIGHKRFSLEGAESTIPMLDAVLNSASDHGITEAVIGMSHRGRLNVLSNVLQKSYDKIFREFEGDIDPDSVQGSGDVKYHLGATGVHRTPDGKEVALTLSSNPSHLEAVNPVVEGMVRARLDELGDEERKTVLPLLLHGDAAFAGQGVVAETLSLSQLRGYHTGGTVHLVINNQVGFTTGPKQARSSTYATDVAKTVQAPIFHVNGDDPEACVRVMRLALEFRQAFAKDVVVDMLCYRRWGHNEGDDPSYTQPLMYSAIEQRRSVRKLYTEELVNRGDLTLDEAEQALDDFRARLENSLKETRASAPKTQPVAPRPPEPKGVLRRVETGVDRAVLERIALAATSAPAGFAIHPKLARQLEKRREQLAQDAVDWAMGEAFAFGSLVLEGTPVRLAGQDSRRGTFSQRHSVLVNHDDGTEHCPLASLDDEQARFMVYDSPLSEYAAMGFDYGYSVARKDALVAWEGQFGDFMNGAQIVIDQFLVAAEDKWGQTSGLVLLLPHGYEGQGPEHSSARLERFLTLCAEDNIQVAQPTNAAQYFHLLRRQMRRDVRKPLVVLTPKALLRAKAASSPAAAFTSGAFQEILPEDKGPVAEEVRRVFLCSGKIAYDLIPRRDQTSAPAAVLRAEQLYPWPEAQIVDALEGFPNAAELVWVQDEPENMGGWPFSHQRLYRLLRDTKVALRHVARVESASPAVGSAAVHAQELDQLLDEAFASL
ncbi:MAG: multifunctional oxoglutarate decarboxylase/oxoglutarate dehydrogenase thiamine pyrophosphate-binding subunit/dihydrolipoyllysine-residue succinyltransferase subunit [Euzebyaceae bacterium]|nr:multifunctional oxoglutarate decarboxylase/oxoglutarate dehydrogenase thiamine pyrophosphate-binding subunit/dihydrolipoyllysine-residue succinyltransferase subunit [Euzebyaceae bacterium]